MKVNPNRDLPNSAPVSAETKPAARSNDTAKPNFAATNKLAQQLAAHTRHPR